MGNLLGYVFSKKFFDRTSFKEFFILAAFKE